MENDSTYLTLEDGSSSEDIDYLKYSLRTVLHVFVMLLGMPGNSLILLVYKNKRQKTSTHVFIMSLATADLSICIMRVLDITAEGFHLAGYVKDPLVIHLLRPLEYTAMGTTIIVTAMISADRYDCICRPLNRFLNARRAKIAAFTSLMVSLLINTPALFEKLYPKHGGPFWTAFVLSLQIFGYLVNVVLLIICYRRVYVTIQKHVQVGIDSSLQGGNINKQPASGSTIAKDASVCTSEAAVIRKPTPVPSTGADDVNQGNNDASDRNVQKPSKDSPSKNASCGEPEGKDLKGLQAGTHPLPNDSVVTGSSGSNQGANSVLDKATAPKKNAPVTALQRKTTKMLFITSFVFLLSWLPYWVFVVTLLASDNKVPIDPVFSVITDEGRAFVYLNNVVNPLIYGFANSRFRKDCKEVLSKMKLF